MTIEELEDKHSQLIEIGLGNTEEELAEYWFSRQKEHTKLSIQFAISVLEEVQKENELSFLDLDLDEYLSKKIQELKQYLDERDTN